MIDFNKITAELEFVGSSVHNVEIKSEMVRITNKTKRSFGLDIRCSRPLEKDNQKLFHANKSGLNFSRA